MENKERMLHFDVSLGCTAEALVCALADLNGNLDCVKAGLEACGIYDAQAVLKQEKSKTLSGSYLELPLDSHISAAHIPSPKSGARRRPFWARKRPKPSQSEQTPEQTSQTWLKQEGVTLPEIKHLIETSDLHPIAQALALKTLILLSEALEKASRAKAEATVFSSAEGSHMLWHIVAFSQLLSSINPSAVTASRVAISTTDSDSEHRGWLYALAEEVPTIDRPWPAPYCDPLGLALLRSVTNRFGARGESTIERHGVGLSNTNAHPRVITRALLCHLPSIASRSVSSGSITEVLPQVEVTAVLGHGVDIGDLMKRLQGFGMRSVYTWQVFEASTFPRMMLRGVLPHAEAETAIEAILVTGEALELSTQTIETQKLHQRTVSVPFGRGQKMQACRVNEWMWSGKILRADPDPGDLAVLVQSTGFAQDVLRADVLAAWRKFRQLA